MIFPGGFTYGDYLGSGVIFSFIVRTRLENSLAEFAEKKGKILGICNGFQILVRLSLLPFPGETPTLSLEENERGRFECRWIPLLRKDSKVRSFKYLPESFYLPVAHMEGRVTFSDKKAIERVVDGGQAVFFYGKKEPDVSYPDNPNGSQMGIAGITDPSGSILGLMPHPERFLDLRQYPFRGEAFKEPLGITFMKLFFRTMEE